MYHQYLVLVLIYILSLVVADTKYRLNSSIVPSDYHLLITPYFDTNDEKAFTFNGEVTIKFTTTANIREIKLHSADLNFTATDITVSNLNTSTIINVIDVNPLKFNINYSFAYINLKDELVPNVQYAVKILYSAPLKENQKGFYKSEYMEKGVKKWMAATDMEPTYARRVFPCFDEPKLKAVFTIQIDRPSKYKNSLSNTKMRTSEDLGNGYIRETFHPTPLMAAYLVAFVVSEMEPGQYRHGSQEFGIYTRPAAKNQTSFAFDIGRKVVDVLGIYFGIDYYSMNKNLKLDLVTISNFPAVAMENWGLIMFKEPLLLYNPATSGPKSRIIVAQAVAHEISHMWFGNLVTCHWWSDTWLQEGFAQYFQNYVLTFIEPELGSANLMVTDSVYHAYDADSENSSVPISNNDLNSPDEISEHFGIITYHKASSIIRMIHHLIDDDAFKLGLHTYLMNNSFGSGYPELLYSSLDYGVSTFNSLNAYQNITVADVMASWVTQPGHPILHVDVNYNTDIVTLNQERFLKNVSQSSSEIYKIPITYTTGMSPNFNNTKPAFIMDTKKSEFIIANISKTQAWVIFNIQETGFYRVNYDTHSWHRIALALKGSDCNTIHHLNRAKIINDLFDFFFAEKVQFSTLHQVLEFLPNEDDYSVWFAALRGFWWLRSTYCMRYPDAKPIIEAYMYRLLNPIIYRLGYDERPTIDSFEDLRNRQQILHFACTLNHIGCINHTLTMFKGLKENAIEVPASLRSVVYSTGLRYGTADDYDFLWNRLINTEVASEIAIIIDALSYTSNKEKLKSYLLSSTVENSPINPRDQAILVLKVFDNDSNNWSTILDLIKSDYSLMSKVFSYGRYRVSTIIELAGLSVKTEMDVNKFEAFLADCTQCTDNDKSVGRSALKVAREKTYSKTQINEILAILGKLN